MGRDGIGWIGNDGIRTIEEMLYPSRYYSIV